MIWFDCLTDRMKVGLRSVVAGVRIFGMVLVLLASLGCDLLKARPTDLQKQLFHNAQATFNQGRQLDGEDKRLTMLKAAGQFKALVDMEGIENGYLFYNIGNAYFEAGEKGKAILYYRKAERLIPGFSDLQFNLATTRQDLQTPEMSSSGWNEIVKSVFFWHYLVNYSVRRNLAIIAFVGFWVVLYGMLFKRSALLKTIAAMSLTVTIALGGSYLVTAYELHLVTAGVVVQQQSQVRKGPGFGYEPVYEQPLPEGTEFTLLEKQGDWWKVKLANSDDGWIKAADAEII